MTQMGKPCKDLNILGRSKNTHILSGSDSDTGSQAAETLRETTPLLNEVITLLQRHQPSMSEGRIVRYCMPLPKQDEGCLGRWLSIHLNATIMTAAYG